MKNDPAVREPGWHMRNEVSGQPESGYLIYDSHCRLCVAVKQKLEQRAAHVHYIPYDSRKAAECLGQRYQHDRRPPMAYWVDEKGTVVGGLEAFLPFLYGLRGGRIFMLLWRFRAWRQLMIGLYELVAKYRYRWFGASKESG